MAGYRGPVHALAASVPDAEVPRSEIVATRLARKVAPLFGVMWPQNPFGRTWVCDFGALTLAEIARGAPLPTREEQSALDRARAQRGEGQEWSLGDRSVWTYQRGPTPAALTNATLNRFGPDTKAAVVLTGANRLLREITAAIGSACAYAAGSGLPAELRLAVWAGLVLEAFRGQPALITAAIQARTIQRATQTGLSARIDIRQANGAARCEVNRPGGGEPGIDGRGAVDTNRPIDFDLLDATLPRIRLDFAPQDAAPSGSLQRHQEIVERWCRRLLEIGRPGRGILWLADRGGGHRTVESYVRIGAIVTPLVAEIFPDSRPGQARTAAEAAINCLRLPEPEALAAMPQLEARAHLLATHVLANYLRYDDAALRTAPGLRAATRRLVSDGAAAARAALGADDCVTTLLDVYCAYAVVWDSFRDRDLAPVELAQAVKDLVEGQERLLRSLSRHNLDPGTVSYLLEIGTMALGEAVASLDRPAELESTLVRRWRQVLSTRGVDVGRDLDDLGRLSPAHRFHLQNYAAFLASQGPARDLRAALRLQLLCAEVRAVVVSSEIAEYLAKTVAVRTSQEMVVHIVNQLLHEGNAGAGEDEFSELLTMGLAHAADVLSNPTLQSMLSSELPGAEAVRTADRVLPLIVTAHQAGHPGLSQVMLQMAQRLAASARTELSRVPVPQELNRFAQMSDALAANPPSDTARISPSVKSSNVPTAALGS